MQIEVRYFLCPQISLTKLQNISLLNWVWKTLDKKLLIEFGFGYSRSNIYIYIFLIWNKTQIKLSRFNEKLFMVNKF
jgi:hypothetical protein